MSSKNFGVVVGAFVIGASMLLGGVVGNPALQLFTARVPMRTPTEAARRIEESYSEALEAVEQNYADEVEYEKANQAAIQGMLSTLDPHSNFFTQTEYQKLLQDQDSRFIGIGVNILRHRDGVYVQSPVEGTPAARAGLRFGDRIVEVEGKDTREWTTQQVSNAVRGPRGERVTIKVERAGASVPLTFQIVRDSVPLPSIRTAYMIRPGTGYIGLNGGFNHTTSDELREAIERLQKEGMRQIILDLRNNPGGLLDQSISVASQFVQRGQTVVSVRGREDEQQKVYKNVSTEPVDAPLVVLINRNSASASEIVAGAIQDHGRGLVVGETSFGKGLVQRLFPLPFGAGLTLTTAKYYTPYGRSIQRDYSKGSLYDYYVRHDADDSPEPARPVSPSLPVQPQAPNSFPTPEATPQPTPPPDGPAIKTAAGRLFYGGGGITPDIEAKPLDVSAPVRGRIFEASFFFTRELAAGIVAGLESYRINEPFYGRYPRATDYPINERVLEAFRNYVRRDTTSVLTVAQVDADIEYVRLRLRDDIVTAAYGTEAGGRVLLETDPQILRALEVMPDAKRLAENVRNGSTLN
ncbi:MAG TPA: S41 family peptidase [Pyrinomonadaceae bacterium]|nr:S41 family peptidase [Pyrinomonadaceae bacterium]